MLKAIVNFLNLKLELLNYFDLTRCLCELKTKGDVIAPKEYIANGEFQNIDFDSSDGVSYWRLRDPITVTREANPNKALKRVQTTVPMKLVFSVRRDKLTADDAYSFDRIRQTVVKQLNIDNGALTTALGAAKVTITAPSSDGDPLSVWDSETSGTETQEPDFKFVFGSIDVDIVIDSDTECLPTECDDVDSDILHTFDFCDAAVRDRLTAAQITCLEDALCGVCDDANYTNSDGSYSGTVASGGTLNIPNITVTDSDGSTSSVPSVQDVVCTIATPDTVTITAYSDAGFTIPITEAVANSTVYLKAVPSAGFTPTEYLFFFDNINDALDNIYHDVNDNTSWVVNGSIGTGRLQVDASDDSGVNWIGAAIDFEVTGDTDADAFIAAAGITDPTQQDAIVSLVLQLKADSIWAKFDAIYPLVGGTASQHKYNLINPLDTDAAFRLTFSGGVTHDANGMTGNGSNGWAETHYQPSTDSLQNSASLGFYSKTNNTSTIVDMSTSPPRFDSYVFGSAWYGNVNQTATPNSSTGGSIGMFEVSRVSSSEIRKRKNGVFVATESVTSVSPSTSTLNLMRLSTGSLYSNRNYAFFFIAEGLTDTESANAYTAIQAFQTTLSRNV